MFTVPISTSMNHVPRFAKEFTLLVVLLVCSVSGAFAQGITVTFTTSHYNGYEISCFGVKDGTVQAVASGGTAPYQYIWSTGLTTQSLTALAAGYYKVKVIDAAQNEVEVDITLDEPLVLKVEVEPITYPSGMNISCYNCYNGSINAYAFQGVAPYGYEWSDGSIAEDRTNLGSASYNVQVTDANGCNTTSESVFLQEPERSDWTMNGNANTNPVTQYIGTSDNKDVVFRTQDQERLRITAAGELRASSLTFPTGYGLLMVDSLGTMKRLTSGTW